MKHRLGPIAAVVFALAMATSAAGQAPAHQRFTVGLGPGLTQAASGRLLIFAQPAGAGPTPAMLRPGGPNGFIAARDVARIAPGQVIEIDAEDIAFPAGLSTAPAGDYTVQVVLDVDRNYAYQPSPSAGDLIGIPVRVRLPAAAPALVLDRAQPAAVAVWDTPTAVTALTTAAQRERFARIEATKARTERLVFQSRLLTQFWGRPTVIRAYVLTPPGYDKGRGRYPAVYRTEGFGASFNGNFEAVLRTYDDMQAGRTPPMIWVFLDHAGPTGTHEFADSVNNGPVGKALTEELIPDLERRYRMDTRRTGRFLTGHSSGGWAALWLQVRYPKLFGGTWPTAPDPVDFHDFTNIDIYAPGANAYRRPDGSPIPLVRRNGVMVTTFKAYTQQEHVLGEVGGQEASFDWVFSPRGRDGRPQPLFDRATGDIDPAVAAYWRDNYDIAHIVRRDWARLKPDLDGKIHLAVGTLDTFYLDGAAHRLQAVLDGLGARSEFRFVEGRDHGNLAAEGSDPTALNKKNAWAMYAVARPGAVRPRPAR